MWIEFYSSTPGQELAEYLARFIYPEAPAQEGIPFRSGCGDWWELSMTNDHKLDERPERDEEGRRRFTYRDRYGPEERMDRIEQALRDHPGVHLESIRRL